VSTLINDIKYGLRMLAKRPGFTAIVVLVLAVGIGANTALFSVFKTVVLSPLPFPQPKQLMFVNSTMKGQENLISGPDYVDWREQNQVFSALCAVQLDQRYTLTGTGSPRVVRGWGVTNDFHQVLGVQPYLGRWFLPEDATQGKAGVAVLGYRFWKSSFQGDANFLGTQIVLDGAPLTVVGIAPANLGFLETMTQVFVPMQQDQLNGHRDRHFLFAIGRLKPEVSLPEARADMTVIAERQAAQYPATNKYKGASVMPLQDVLIREVRTVFGISYGAALLVLLIACVNVANLLLVKSMTRGREIAVRCALGAGRLRIVRLVLTESLLLAFMGGAVGLLLAFGALDLLAYLLPRVGNQGTPIFDEFKLDTAVLGFTFFIALLSGVLFGLMPAWHASRLNLNEVLKTGGRTTTGNASHHRTLNILVGSEVALATVLLLGAGLLVKSYAHLHQAPPGFNPIHVTAMELELPRQAKYETQDSRLSFYQELLRRVAALPEVQSVGAVNYHPLNIGRTFSMGFSIKGQSLAPGEILSAPYRNVSSNYFSTMKIPLQDGRLFTEHDDGSDEPVLIVNQAFCRQFFPQEEPIGRQVRVDFCGPAFRRIVGVVGNVKARDTDLNQVEYPPMMYEPIDQTCQHSLTMMVRTHGDPSSLTHALQQAVWALDGDLPISQIQTLTRTLDNTMAIPRFCMMLLLLVAAVALSLAMMGIYSVIAYALGERMHEIGIRMVFGAQAGNILRLTMQRGFVLIAVGAFIGLLVALALGRVVQDLLYQTNQADPVVFGMGILFLVGTGLLACYIPARRAARIDPMEALRYE